MYESKTKDDSCVTDDLFDSMEGDRVPFPIEDDAPPDNNGRSTTRNGKCDGCTEDPMVFLFQLVFKSSQEPDEWRSKMQTIFAWVLIGALGLQIIWAIGMITWIIIFNDTILTSSNLPFISLLVTSILAEVVAMAFFVVRYVFRSPITELIGVLNEVLKNGHK